MESLLEKLTLNDDDKLETCPVLDEDDQEVELEVAAPPSLPQYLLPPELSVRFHYRLYELTKLTSSSTSAYSWRKMFVEPFSSLEEASS